MTRFAVVFGSVLLLACRPGARSHDAAVAGDPGPPAAPVVATITPYGAVQGDDRIAGRADSKIAVVEHGPEGEGWHGAFVTLAFSEPMLATVVPTFTFEPPLEGTARWTDASHLTFSVTSGIAMATAYTVKVRGDVESIDGERKQLDLGWSLSTARPSVQIEPTWADHDWYGENVRSWRTGFEITVSTEVTAAALRKALKVTAHPTGGDAKKAVEVPYTLERRTDYDRGMAWVLRPRGRWPLGSTVRAEVRDTLVGKEGPLSVVRGASASIDTTPGVTAEVACADAFDGGCGASHFEVVFSQPVRVQELRKLSITPRPKGLKIEPWWSHNGKVTNALITGNLVVGQRYRVAIAQSLQDIHGHPLAGARSFDLDVVPPSPVVDLSTHEGILSATQPPTIGLETRFIEDVSVETAVLDDATLAALLVTQPEDRTLPKRVKPKQETLTLRTGGAYAWSSTAFDLTKLIGKKHGATFVRVRPGELVASARGKTVPKPVHGLYQVTDLGAFVGLSPAMSFVRVSRLSTGEPVEGAHVTLYAVSDGKARATGRHGPSDANGIVRLPAEGKLAGSVVAIVHTDDDRFALRLDDTHAAPGGWRGADGQEKTLSAIVTDRPLYRAGDRVRVLGWAAKSTSTTASTLAPSGRPMVEVSLVDAGGRTVAKRTVRVKTYGKYWATLELPEHAGLGRYQAVARIEDTEFDTSFEVRDFRTPTFDMRAAVADGDVRRGTAAQVSANASYLHGMPVPIVEARNTATCHARSFTPAAHAEWTPADIEERHSSRPVHRETIPLDARAKEGHVEFEVSTSSLPAGGSYGCRVDLAVQDAAHEEMGAEVAFNVHPSRYLLLSPTPWSVDADAKLTVEVRAVDFAGKRVAGGAVQLKLEHTWWDEGKRRRAVAGSCKRSIGAEGSTTCTFIPKKLGDYELVLTGKVDGAKVSAQRSFYVWQHRSKPRPASEPPHHLEIQRSVEKAAVGDDVVLSIAGPEATGSGVLAQMHGGLRALESFRLDNHRARATKKVEDAWIPAMRFAAFVTTPGSTTQLPALRSAFADVTVPFESRRLAVTVASPEVAAPDEEVSFAIEVHDANGAPAASHVTVWAVDEAILALKDFTFPDFVAAFAVDRGGESSFGDDFEFLRHPYVVRDDPWDGESFGLGGIGTSGRGGGSGSGAGYGGLGMRGPVPMRKRFEATPVFIADASTGDDGRVTVKGRMPENLTTFRVLAIASASIPGAEAIGRFGRGESRTRVTTDLAVRPVLPRVMRPGDVAEVAAMVDNLAGTRGELTVELALRDADGVVKLRGKATKRAQASAQVRIPFELEALAPGTAKVQVSVTLTPEGSGSPLTDAMEVELPVTLERTMMKRAAHHGSLEQENAAAIAVRRPEDAAPGSLDVEVSMHTSLLGGYKDNVDDLVQYPYGCIEQTSTRLVPLLALADLGKSYPLGIGNAEAFVGEAIARMQTMQTSEGGFGYWPDATETHFYATAYATWVMGMAARAGHDVPEEMLGRAQRYLSDRLHAWENRDIPTTHEDVRMAMALQALAGTPLYVPGAADALHARADELPIFGQALLLMAMHEAQADDPRVKSLLAKILSHVDERDAFARTRAPAVQYTQYFDSPMRTDAMVLLALTRVAPDLPVVEKLARGLGRARDAGQLRNTQENAYALLAMASYARSHEAQEPDMFARAWLGPALLEDVEFEGRTFAIHEAEAKLPVRGSDTPKVTLAKQGNGRLYYRVGMRWTPAEAPREPVAQGIAIERTVKGADGREATKIGVGSLATIDVAVTADIQQDYVVIEVPLPAGLEAVDTTIGKGARARAAGGGGWWVSHRELRADRIVLFVDHLVAGRHTISLPLRATTPGRYRMPPARAESMYYPEIFGYTAGEDVQVVSH